MVVRTVATVERRAVVERGKVEVVNVVAAALTAEAVGTTVVAIVAAEQATAAALLGSAVVPLAEEACSAAAADELECLQARLVDRVVAAG